MSETELAQLLARRNGAQRQQPDSEVPDWPPRAAEDVALVHGNGRGMNKTEAAYAQLLEIRLRAGEIYWFRFESIKLRLADKTFYTPDFSVLPRSMRLEFHEVKGFWRDDARVKIKVAAELYPFRFVAVSKQRKKAGGGWAFEEFGS